MAGEPSRRDIWLANLNPTLGREQAGTRPVLILSTNTFNHGPADLVIAVSLTTRVRRVQSWVPLAPPEGGLRAASFAMCETVRSLSRVRLIERWGSVSVEAMEEVEDMLRVLLEL